MPDKGTQYQAPLVLQLAKNREEQRAADAQKNFEEKNHDLQFFTRPPTEGLDFGTIIEWGGVFFRVFWLALFSGSFLFVWVFILKLAGY